MTPIPPPPFLHYVPVSYLENSDMKNFKKDELFQSGSLYSRDQKQWAILGLLFLCIVAARPWSSEGSEPSMAESSFIKSNTAKALDPAEKWIIHLHGSSSAQSTYSKSQGSQDYYSLLESTSGGLSSRKSSKEVQKKSIKISIFQSA